MRVQFLVSVGLILSVEAATISKDARCGPEHKSVTCKNSQWGSCCSKYGWCGSTYLYCGEGCQSKYGLCKNVVSSSRVASSSSSSKVATTSTKSPVPSPTQPVSKNARCGARFGGQTCQGSIWGECCSQYFYCGNGPTYCGPQSCHKGYGRCDTVSSARPSSSDTRSSTAKSSSTIGATSLPRTSSTGSFIPASSVAASSSVGFTSSAFLFTISSPSAVSSVSVASSSSQPTLPSPNTASSPTPILVLSSSIVLPSETTSPVNTISSTIGFSPSSSPDGSFIVSSSSLERTSIPSTVPSDVPSISTSSVPASSSVAFSSVESAPNAPTPAASPSSEVGSSSAISTQTYLSNDVSSVTSSPALARTSSEAQLSDRSSPSVDEPSSMSIPLSSTPQTSPANAIASSTSDIAVPTTSSALLVSSAEDIISSLLSISHGSSASFTPTPSAELISPSMSSVPTSVGFSGSSSLEASPSEVVSSSGALSLVSESSPTPASPSLASLSMGITSDLISSSILTPSPVLATSPAVIESSLSISSSSLTMSADISSISETFSAQSSLVTSNIDLSTIASSVEISSTVITSSLLPISSSVVISSSSMVAPTPSPHPGFISNGGFEQTVGGTLPNIGGGGTIAVRESTPELPAAEGSRYLELQLAAISTTSPSLRNSVLFYRNFTAVQGQAYYMSVKVRRQRDLMVPQCYLMFSLSTSHIVGSTYFDTGNEWEEISGYVKWVFANERVNILLSFWCPSNLEVTLGVDDLTILEVANPPPAPESLPAPFRNSPPSFVPSVGATCGQAIREPSFENFPTPAANAANPWEFVGTRKMTPYNWGVTLEATRTGSRSMRLTLPLSTSGYLGTAEIHQRNVVVCPGTLYQFTSWNLIYIAGTQATCQVALKVNDNVLTMGNPFSYTPSRAWSSTSAYYLTGTSETSVGIKMKLYCVGPTNTPSSSTGVYFDDVTFTPVTSL